MCDPRGPQSRNVERPGVLLPTIDAALDLDDDDAHGLSGAISESEHEIRCTIGRNDLCDLRVGNVDGIECRERDPQEVAHAFGAERDAMAKEEKQAFVFERRVRHEGKPNRVAAGGRISCAAPKRAYERLDAPARSSTSPR